MNGQLVQVSVNSFDAALRTLAAGVAEFVPRLIVAILAFIILWVVAVALGKLIEQIIRSLKLDSLLQGLGAEEPLSRAGFKLNVGGFLGGLVRWFFIIIAFLVAVDIMQLTQVSQFLSEVVLVYLPNVAVASLIVIAAALLADVAQKIVRGSAQAAGFPSAGLVGAIAKWAIWVFALLAAFYQLKILTDLISTILTAFVAMFAIAGGLAFGLGGKDAAADVIAKMRKDMKEH